jgi:hypothetical protein
MDILLALVKLGMVAFVAGLGAYFGSYLKKKGENVATKEDIKNVVEQVKAVTQATKEIETKISNQVWDRQKQWELKREVLLEATKRLSAIENGLLSLNTFWASKTAEKKSHDDATWIRLEHEYVTRWHDAIKYFEEAEALVHISCSKELMLAFSEVGDLMRTSAAKITQSDGAIYTKTNDERNKKFANARVAIRKELGIGFAFTPQSTGSSASPNPD